MIGLQLGELLGAANPDAVGIGAAIGTAAAGPIGAVVGGVIGSAFGGSREQVGSGVEIGVNDSGVFGQSFDRFERERSLFRGTQTTFEFRELDAEVRAGLNEWFDNLNDSIVESATALGVEGADSILDGFQVASARLNSEEEIADYLEDATRDAYRLAFDELAPELQDIITDNVSFDTSSIEEIGEIFTDLGIIASEVAPRLEVLGFNLGETVNAITGNTFALVEELGGLDVAAPLLSRFGTDILGGDTSSVAIDQAQASLDAFNATLGLTGEAAIDTADEAELFIQSLNLTTEAGISTAAQLILLTDDLLLVEDAATRTATNIRAVSDAAFALNLEFDATSPVAGAAADAIIQLVGGLDSFQTATNRFYNDFFSLEERQQISLASATQTVIAFNDSLTATGQAAIFTADDFVTYAQSLDLTTDAGQQAFAQVLLVSDAMKIFTDEGVSLEEVIASLPVELQGSLNQMVADANLSANSISGSSANILGSLSDTSGELFNLGNASSNAASAIGNAANTINNRLTFTEALQQGVINSVAPFFDLTQGSPFNPFPVVQGSFMSGTSFVPETGIYELHQGEVVLPPDVSRWFRDNGIPVGVTAQPAGLDVQIAPDSADGSDDGLLLDLVAEVRQLREDNQRIASQADAMRARQMGETRQQTSELRELGIEQRRTSNNIASAVDTGTP